jgi:membrane-associated phospholipid phosphatase
MIKLVKTTFNKISATVALVSLELLAVLVVFFVALFGFVFLARMIFLDHKEDIDLAVFNYLASHVSDINTTLMQTFSFLGTHFFLIPANILLVLYFSFISKHRWYSIKIPVIALSSLLLMMLLKQLFGRHRPLMPLLDEARGLSFPSGHAMMSFSFYGLMIYLVWQNISRVWLKWTLTIALFLLIIFIGLSRVYLRVHFASDVLAGFCLGLMWLILSLWVLNIVEKFSRKKAQIIAEKVVSE